MVFHARSVTGPPGGSQPYHRLLPLCAARSPSPLFCLLISLGRRPSTPSPSSSHPLSCLTWRLPSSGSSPSSILFLHPRDRSASVGSLLKLPRGSQPPTEPKLHWETFQVLPSAAPNDHSSLTSLRFRGYALPLGCTRVSQELNLIPGHAVLGLWTFQKSENFTYKFFFDGGGVLLLKSWKAPEHRAQIPTWWHSLVSRSPHCSVMSYTSLVLLIFITVWLRGQCIFESPAVTKHYAEASWCQTLFGPGDSWMKKTWSLSW